MTSRHIPGIGPDEPTVTNEHGAKQSALPYRFDLVPPRAAFALAEVMAQGAKRYAKDNWRGIALDDHLNHALAHIFGYMAGDRSDPHLEHALTRLAMAVETADRDRSPS